MIGLLASEPAQVYLFARHLRNVAPTFRFLAYYHVIEYFLPDYKQKIEASLDPKRGTAQRNKISEQATLDSALLACIDAEDLRAFLGEEVSGKARLDQLRIANHALKSLQLDVCTIAQCCEPSWLREGRGGHGSKAMILSLSTWAYKLRCRIVHSKRDAGHLFALDRNVDHLEHCIALLAYVARSVLTAGTSCAKAVPLP